MSIRLAFLLGLLATAATSVASICDNSANDPARCNNPDCVTGPSGAECCIGDCYEGQGPGYLCKMRSSQTCYTQWDIKLKLFDWCDCPPAPPTTTIVARTTAAPVVNIGWWEISTQATTRVSANTLYIYIYCGKYYSGVYIYFEDFICIFFKELKKSLRSLLMPNVLLHANLARSAMLSFPAFTLHGIRI